MACRTAALTITFRIFVSTGVSFCFALGASLSTPAPPVRAPKAWVENPETRDDDDDLTSTELFISFVTTVLVVCFIGRECVVDVDVDVDVNVDVDVVGREARQCQCQW